MRFTETFIRRPVLSSVVSAGLVLVGAHQAWAGWIEDRTTLALGARIERGSLDTLFSSLLSSDYSQLRQRDTGWMGDTLGGASGVDGPACQAARMPPSGSSAHSSARPASAELSDLFFPAEPEPFAAHGLYVRGAVRVVVQLLAQSRDVNVEEVRRGAERAGRDPASVADSKEVGGIRGHSPHRFLERQDLALAHPRAEHVRRVARVAQHVEVRAAVAQAPFAPERRQDGGRAEPERECQQLREREQRELTERSRHAIATRRPSFV